jgi:hypothetical protein
MHNPMIKDKDMPIEQKGFEEEEVIDVEGES